MSKPCRINGRTSFPMAQATIPSRRRQHWAYSPARTGKHSGPEGRNGARIEPKNCLTSLLKPVFIPLVVQWDIEPSCCSCCCCCTSFCTIVCTIVVVVVVGVVVVGVGVVVVAVQYLFFPCAPPLASAGVGGQINGFVRPTLHYVHTCPTCGSCIRSTKKSGRIQSKHKQANGRMCPRTEWQLR